MVKSMDTYSQLLEQYEALIHRTLSRANVRPHYRDYEDLAQELRIKLLDIYDLFDGDALEEDKFRFSAYAGKGLYWHTMNLLREEKDGDMPSDLEEMDLIENQPPQPSLFETAQLSLQSFLHEAKKKLNEKELFVLHCCMEGSYKQKEIAEKLEVTSQRVLQYRKKIAEKLVEFQSLLYD